METDDTAFFLHPRLAADTLPLGRLALSHVLLMNDARYPWLVLVPGVAGMRELHDLAPPDRMRLMDEVTLASEALATAFRPDKINVGAIGNIVAQLHVHVVARHEGDPAWPAPVWGVGQAEPYAEGQVSETLAALRERLPGLIT